MPRPGQSRPPRSRRWRVGGEPAPVGRDGPDHRQGAPGGEGAEQQDGDPAAGPGDAQRAGRDADHADQAGDCDRDLIRAPPRRSIAPPPIAAEARYEGDGQQQEGGESTSRSIRQAAGKAGDLPLLDPHRRAPAYVGSGRRRILFLAAVSSALFAAGPATAGAQLDELYDEYLASGVVAGCAHTQADLETRSRTSPPISAPTTQASRQRSPTRSSSAPRDARRPISSPRTS